MEDDVRSELSELQLTDDGRLVHFPHNASEYEKLFGATKIRRLGLACRGGWKNRRFADGVCSLGLVLFGAFGAKNHAHNMVVCSNTGRNLNMRSQDIKTFVEMFKKDRKKKTGD